MVPVHDVEYGSANKAELEYVCATSRAISGPALTVSEPGAGVGCDRPFAARFVLTESDVKSMLASGPVGIIPVV